MPVPPPFDSFDLLRTLVPLRRDIVSDGIDAAFAFLAERFPLEIHEFASESRAWTWHIPNKWSCSEAYIETLDGRRIIDQSDNVLHVASYSTSIDAVVSREELLEHLHVHPHLEDEPAFIFYYYRQNWGFSCGRRRRDCLTDPHYRVVVRSRFEPGTLKVAEWHLPGESKDCFVLSTNLCHPGQANDGLCGVVNALQVMAGLAARPRRRYSYRMLIGPETIGAVAWLSRHEHLIPTLCGGVFAEMTGLPQPAALQLSYFGDTDVDRCLRAVVEASEAGAFCTPYRGLIGNDERQFNGPGVRVPMLSFSRANPWGHAMFPFREYHSLKDSLDNICHDSLERSQAILAAMVEAWENDYYPLNRFKGEAFLEGAGLAVDRNRDLLGHRTMLRMMDMIDGTNAVSAIALHLKLKPADVWSFVARMAEAGLVELLDRPVATGRYQQRRATTP